jgi:Na+/H+-dicarboxylate symporter
MKLWQKVIIGLLLGIAAGYYLKEDAQYLKPLGTIFINLIKMVIVPLVFFALVSGITNMGAGKNVSRVGVKAIFTFLFTAAFAVCIGLVAGNIFKPGVGVQLHFEAGAAGAAAAPAAKQEAVNVGQTLLEIIPDNALKAMVDGHILQVIIFAIFTGITINMVGEKAAQVRIVAQQTAQVTFKMIELIVQLAPYGVFGYIAWAVGTQGFDIIVSLAKLVMCVLAACLVQYLLFGIFILIFSGLSPLPFYRKMIEPQTLAFSTSSSKATLTTTMRVLHEKLGVSENSTNFVLPLGAAINMDGTAIYLGICALFFAQATGITLSQHDYLTLVLTCTLASIGAAGIPSGSLIFMGMVLSSVGLPIEGIGIIAGVDRILDMFRTTLNITGDAAITLIVDKTEGTLNTKQYHKKV